MSYFYKKQGKALHTFALNWRQLGHARPRWGKSSACNCPTTWRWFIRSCQPSIISCGNNSHDPSLELKKDKFLNNSVNWKLVQMRTMQKNFNGALKSQIPEMSIWIRFINCFVAAITEILSTITALHFVTTFSTRNCHVTRRTELRITMDFFHTEHFVDLFEFPTLLIFL